MINIPIAERLTPTGGASTATAPEGQENTLDGIDFLEIMAEMPLPDGAGMPQIRMDDTEQDVAVISPAQVVDRQKVVLETNTFLPQVITAMPQLEANISEGSQDSLPDPVSDSETNTRDMSVAVSAPDNLPNLEVPIAVIAPGLQKETRVAPVADPLVDAPGTDKNKNAASFAANTIPAQRTIIGANESFQKTAVQPAQRETSNSALNEKVPSEVSKANVTAAIDKVQSIPPNPTLESQTVPADAGQPADESQNPAPTRYSIDGTAQSVFVRPKQQETDTTPAVSTPTVKKGFIRRSAVFSPEKSLDTAGPKPVEKQTDAVLPDKSVTALQDTRISEILPKLRTQPVAPGQSKPAPAESVQSGVASPLRIPTNISLHEGNTIDTAPIQTASVATPEKITTTSTSVSSDKPASDTQIRSRRIDTPHVLPVMTTNPAAQPTVAMQFGVHNPTVPDDATLDPDVTESLESFDLLPTGPRHTDPASLRANLPPAPSEIPRHVARQLADVARQMPDRPVELTLNPEELGRIRLTFTLTDGGINVAVLTERGETMDMMRRHIETLAQEFRDMGYSDVGFQFSQNSQGSSDGGGATEHHQTLNMPLPEPENTSPAKLSLEPSTGLDLRL